MRIVTKCSLLVLLVQSSNNNNNNNNKLFASAFTTTQMINSFSKSSSSLSSSSSSSWLDDIILPPSMTTEQTQTTPQPEEEEYKKPKWMNCINGVSHKTGPLNEIVSKIANIPLTQSNNLIEIGAIWARMDAPSTDEILDQYNGYTNVRVQYSDLQKGWKNQNANDDISTFEQRKEQSNHKTDEEQEEADLEAYIEAMENRRYTRIMKPSIIQQGTDIRIYPNPRRFKSCAELDKSKLLHEDTTFLIVDKPPMLPTQPDASNYMENCPGCVEMNIGPFTTIHGKDVERPLLCHRVDACVAGCVVLSKDENGQAVFTRFQRERKVKKVYLAITKNKVPTGMHVHWMWSEMTKRGGRGGPPCQLVSHEVPLNRKKAKSWTRCMLEVVKCEPIDIDVDNRYGYDPGQEQHYQSTIRLVTGRKHQVRAQLSSLGSPIVRDTLYEPISGMTLDVLNGGGEGAMDMEDAIESCRVPQQPIGLQANAILFGGIHAKASTPWWGDGSTSTSTD